VYQPNSVTVFLEQSPSVQASLSADWPRAKSLKPSWKTWRQEGKGHQAVSHQHWLTGKQALPASLFHVGMWPWSYHWSKNCNVCLMKRPPNVMNLCKIWVWGAPFLEHYSQKFDKDRQDKHKNSHLCWPNMLASLILILCGLLCDASVKKKMGEWCLPLMAGQLWYLVISVVFLLRYMFPWPKYIKEQNPPVFNKVQVFLYFLILKIVSLFQQCLYYQGN
jgi:hypothetical protein